MEAVMDKIKLVKYSAYQESGVGWIGEIPKHWELTRLGTRFIERRTKVSDKEYAPLSVTKQGILPQLENAAKTNDGDNRKLVKAGDFVINSRSDRKGSSGIAKADGSVSLINIVMEPINVDPTYCNYLFKGHAFVEEFYRMGHGIVADLWTTRYDEMKAIMVGIPPKEEQVSIAKFLDCKTSLIDEAIDIKEKQIDLLKERRQILIHKAITRGLNPNVQLKGSGVEWIDELPEEWGVKKLGYISRVGNGSTPSRSTIKYWEQGTFPWLNSSKVNDEIITTADQFVTLKALKECHLPILEPGTLVIAITGEGKTRGMAALCKIEATINQHLAYVKVNESKINPEFLLQYLQAMYSNIRADSSGLGSTKGAITCENIKKFIIPIPSKSEQKNIVAYIENIKLKISTAISLKEKEIEKLKEYKSTLINSAVTGKIKVC